MNEIIVKKQEGTENKKDLNTLELEIVTLQTQANQMALTYICGIGQRLMEAKEQVGHGNWGKWLEEKVHYSQSTAENYITIYKEYGEQQLNFLFSQNSESYKNLGYTKLLALTAIEPEEREKFVEENNVEELSTRELKSLVDQAVKEKETVEKKLGKAEADYQNAVAEAAKKDAEIEKLKAEMAEADTQKTIVMPSEEETEKLKKEYEKKIKKLEEERKKAEKKAKTALEKLDKKDAEVEQKAKEIAEAEIKKIQEEKEGVCTELQTLKKQLENSDNENLIRVNVYFTEAQESINKLLEALDTVKDVMNFEGLNSGIRKTIAGMVLEG